ncbi:HAD-IA family hydrolase [Micromonospora sagamiensis]|uniref:AHBA synthesis associated protein n=1 Tax=Micromonospora sagamiensis TaxID=47875 RepID=A0A562WHD8_9ACTN|nr:HAD-IA family hydrolase [Micromonospora sagamiensis]TWJ29693.1 AHBA synthesis associated protein [Micromonospora sagamiensis]
MGAGPAGGPLVPGGVRAVVLDLDGVLVDSLAVARTAFTLAYREVVGDGVVPVDEYCRHPGRYLPEVLRLMGLPAGMAEPFARESNRLAHLVTPVPGVPELLRQLRGHGIGLAVATGRSGERARFVLDRVGLLPLVDHVVGADEVPRPKPAPDIVRRALDLLDVPPGRALMVGDAPADLASARSAGVVAVAALWGESDPETLRAAAPDVTLTRVGELAALCLGG